MKSFWKMLESLLFEAKTAADYKEQLLRYATKRYDEHTADEIQNALQRMQFKDFKQHIASEYMNSEMNSIVDNMLKAAIAQHRAKNGPNRNDPQAQAIRNSNADFVSPEDHAEKEKAIDAARKLRASAGRSFGAAKVLHKPHSGSGTQAVGSAGQNQPKTQPSVAAGIQPQKNTGAKSGLVGAQRAVDRYTKEKGEKAGAALAAKLGVPTTAERTKVDQVSGEENVQIWSPDRIMKFMDPDQNPGRASADAGKGDAISRMDLVKMGVMKRMGAPSKIGPDRPPRFDGEVWKPHGREETGYSGYADKATGNFKGGRTTVDPKHTGQSAVGLDGKWVLPSVYASTTASRGASARAAGEEPGQGHNRSGTAADRAGHDAASLQTLMQKYAHSPRLQQKLRDLAKQRGIDLRVPNDKEKKED